MDRKRLGFALYNLHIAIVIGFAAAFVFLPTARPLLFFVFVPFFLGHIVYGRCPLTLVERRLHGEDITILDPILDAVGLPRSRDNRHNLNAVLSCIFMLAFLSTWTAE